MEKIPLHQSNEFLRPLIEAQQQTAISEALLVLLFIAIIAIPLWIIAVNSMKKNQSVHQKPPSQRQEPKL
jgi:ABC-type glycerol-3-phosphate transport system permease component